jgi:hypothetical protein
MNLMPLQQYCQDKRVVVLNPGSSAYEAARALEDNHIGAVLVQDGGRVLGIVTDRDLALRVTGSGADPGQTPIADVMTPDPVTLSAEDSEDRALDLMRKEHVRRIPIRDGDGVGVAGIVTLDDLILSGMGCESIKPQAPCFGRSSLRHRASALMGKRRAELLKKGELPNPERTGLFTTAIVSITDGDPIALFYTGRKYAGENLADLLKVRHTDLEPPILMCDALDSRNLPKGHTVIESNCAAHARRGFVDQVVNFPADCKHVLEELRKIFVVDAQCQTAGLSPEERLRVHQRDSGPVMESGSRATHAHRKHTECLNQFVFFGELHLRYVVKEFIAHYHCERFHQGLGGQLIEKRASSAAEERTSGKVVCRSRLGGILNFYDREAA